MPVPTEQKLPTNVDDWNALIRETAAKENIDLGKVSQENLAHATGQTTEETPAAAPAVAAPAKQAPAPAAEEETSYKLTVEINGKDIPFEGKTESDVYKQAFAAMQAANAATAEPPAAPVVEKKGLTEDEMFQLGIDLQQGKVEALETYIERSGAIERFFEKQGVKISDLKASTAERQSATDFNALNQAGTKFMEMVKDGTVDYPHYLNEKGEVVASPQNTKMMGWQINQIMAEKNLRPTQVTAEIFVEAANKLRGENMLREVTKPGTAPAPKKVVSSTTQFGASGNHGKTAAAVPTGQQKIIKESEWESMNQYQRNEFYNTAIQEGFQPENIVIQR